MFRKRGLLLWLVHTQHDHYKSKCERKSGGIYLPFHYESGSEIKSPDFHLYCDPGDLVQDHNVGIPEKCWKGVLAQVLAKMGVLAGVLAQVLASCFVSVFPKSPTCQHLCQHSGQHPHFCQHLCQHPRQHFSGIPTLGSCARPPGSQHL